MDIYFTLLEQAAAGLATDSDPDGLPTRQALLLAARAGAAAEHSTGAGLADWDLFTVAMADAVETAQAGMDEMQLVDELPSPGPDSSALRSAITSLVRGLADVYAAAAAGETGQAWRRLAWAQVALRLDDAVAELA